MKRISNILPVLAISIFVIAGCKDEAALKPSDMSSFDRFDFPQGNNSYDNVFEEIFEDHSVMCLYKDFTEFDLGRTWTGSSNTNQLTYETFDSEEITVLADWLKEYYFDPLGKATNGLFKRYLYLPKNLTKETAYGPNRITFDMSGLDFWTISPDVASFMSSGEVSMSDSLEVVWPVIYMFANMLDGAYQQGNITLPEDFDEGIDLETRTRPYVQMDTYYNDFWGRRGFLQVISSTGSYGGLGNAGGFVDISDCPKEVQFRRFVLMAMFMRNLWSYFEDGEYWADCPLLKGRFEKIINHLKAEYGIDLREYGRNAWKSVIPEGADIDDYFVL